MPYCPKCGVEVEPDIARCPLCSFPIPDTGESEKRDIARENNLLNRYRLKKIERKKRWREARPFIYITVLLTLTLLSIIFGVLDLYYSRALTWSRYVIAVNFSVAVSLFFLMGILHSFSVNFLGINATAAWFLYLLDSFDTRSSWFWDLGMVICFNIILWTLVLRYVVIHSRRRGLNIPAYIMFALSFAFISIDIMQDVTVHGTPALTWSIPVISVSLSLGLLFMFLHILLSATAKDKIKRSFHV